MAKNVYSIVSKAVKSGDLPHISTQTCTDCGKQAEHYDHRDYSKPLDVEAVCCSCNLKRGSATNKQTVYLYVEITKRNKAKVKRMAKKAGMSIRQWVDRLVKNIAE